MDQQRIPTVPNVNRETHSLSPDDASYLSFPKFRGSSSVDGKNTSSFASRRSDKFTSNGVSSHAEYGTPSWPAYVGAMITLAVAFAGITYPPLWSDEAATISATNRSLQEFGNLLSNVDAVHGFYYLILIPWVDVFGTSALSMRTPSAFVMAVGSYFTVKIAMMYVRRVFPARVVPAGLAVGILFAVLPSLASVGQEARGYAFGTTSIVLAWWSYERWLRDGNDRWLILLVCTQVSAVYFTLYAAMVVPLYVIRSVHYGHKAVAKSFGAAVAIGMGILPLVLTAWSQQGQVSWISTTSLNVLQRMASSQFFIGQGISNEEARFDALPYIAVVLSGLTFMIILTGFLRGPLRHEQTWLLSWIALPMLLVLCVQFFGGQFYDERYMIFTSPALVVLLGVITTVCISRHSFRAVIITLIVALCLPAVIAQHNMQSKNNSDYQNASSFLSQADTVFFMDPASRGITTAYPPHKQLSDPMLLSSPQESGTIWGRNRPVDFAFQQTPSGTVAVVARSAVNHDDLVSHFVTSGCRQADNYVDKWNTATLLNCPMKEK